MAVDIISALMSGMIKGAAEGLKLRDDRDFKIKELALKEKQMELDQRSSDQRDLLLQQKEARTEDIQRGQLELSQQLAGQKAQEAAVDREFKQKDLGIKQQELEIKKQGKEENVTSYADSLTKMNGEISKISTQISTLRDDYAFAPPEQKPAIEKQINMLQDRQSELNDSASLLSKTIRRKQEEGFQNPLGGLKVEPSAAPKGKLEQITSVMSSAKNQAELDTIILEAEKAGVKRGSPEALRLRDAYKERLKLLGP